MIKYLAEELSLRLVADQIITIDKRKYYTYGIELIINDVLIFLAIECIAFITKTVLISTVFAIIFCFIRAYTGGYHSKTYVGCCSTTMVNYISMLIFNSVLNKYRIYVGMTMIFLSFPVIWNLSPIRSKNNPFGEKEKNKYKKLSKILVTIISLLFIISTLFLSDKISFVLAWSIFATALLMLIEKILQKKEEKPSEETITRNFGRNGCKSSYTGK